MNSTSRSSGQFASRYGASGATRAGLAAGIRKGGGGGSGEIMYFTIDAVNCPGDGNWAVTPTHYSGGCKAPPGADSYTGEYTVVPRSCPMPEMPDELIGQEGIAARVYNLETCELEWREIDHCPTIGC
jgi:hypothetical protein